MNMLKMLEYRLTFIISAIPNAKADTCALLHKIRDQSFLSGADSAADDRLAAVTELKEKALILRLQGHSQCTTFNDQPN